MTSKQQTSKTMPPMQQQQSTPRIVQGGLIRQMQMGDDVAVVQQGDLPAPITDWASI